MKLVLTLLVRDEVDVLEQQLAFHLAAGVDAVVATDHGSTDGTTAVLERFERKGLLTLLRESGGEYRQAEWVTRMARLAASELGADWVINSDADEFWWPSGGNLKEVLARVPERYTVVQTFVRVFLPRPGKEPFAERMTVRFSPSAPVNDPTSPFRVNTRLLHRASPGVRIATGNAALRGLEGEVLGTAAPIDVLHFPIRGLDHFERKYLTHHATLGERRRGEHVRAFAASGSGVLRELYGALCIDDDQLARGLAAGSLAVDVRLRDALRALTGGSGAPPRFPPRSPSEAAWYAVDGAVLHEGENVRLRRRLDDLELRLGAR
jgi:hypothetical protein